MFIRLAALAVFFVSACAAFRSAAADTLTLSDAFTRVADYQGKTHPQLQLYVLRADILVAEQQRAGQTPPLIAAADLDNGFGTGGYNAMQSSEVTLSLASVLERGGKLEARRVLAQSRIDALALERESTRLDLLAEVARRYLAAVATVQQREIADLDIRQRKRTLAAARQRFQAGASPESVVFTAQAALARAELERDRAIQRGNAARQHLAALWGERDPGFELAGADPLTLPTIEDATALAALLERAPELAQFADERRIREARLQLARSEASADLGWQVGVRRLQEDGDLALVGGLSLPLGGRGRAQPGIRAAEAELEALSIEREARDISLYSTLTEAHGRYLTASNEALRLGSDVLPRLRQAEAAAERAYRAGALGYLEWSMLQSDVTFTRKQQLDAAIDAQRALIELQRLTGQALVTAPPATVQGTQP